MLKFKKTELIIILLIAFIALPVFAQIIVPHMRIDLLAEDSGIHISAMIIVLIVVVSTVISSWSCSLIFPGRLGKSFEIIAIGLGILVLFEILEIFNHFEFVILESFIGHIVKIIAYVFISFGFYSVIKAESEIRNTKIDNK